MDPSPIKLPTHKSPLTISARFVNEDCRCCNVKGPIYGGYHCNDLIYAGWYFHKECAEAPPEIINHPSHPQHPLKLHPRKSSTCNLCGKSFFGFAYRCSLKCDFIVDLTCGINPLPPTIEQPKSHNHPVVFLKEPGKPGCSQCKICKRYNVGCSYACHECEVHFHVECVNFSQEVNHPSHPQHPLELRVYDAYELLTSDGEKTCLLCGERANKPNEVLYCCSICNFIICGFCTKNPPPLTIEYRPS